MSTRNKPLSDKAKALLADLKGNAPKGKSQYVEKLAESAAKRKLANEAALEKKLAREETERSDDGAPQLRFVTEEYSKKIEQAKKDGVTDHLVESVFMKNAERITNSASLSRTEEKKTETTSNLQQRVSVNELIKRRDARREARLAPPSSLTPEIVAEARSRAMHRLERT